MLTADYDLIYLQSGTAILESYLLSGDLYRSVQAVQPAGEPPYPSLTPGGLLLSARRLAVWSSEPAVQPTLENFNRLKLHWRSAWERKVARDAHARLNQWITYLEEYRENHAEHLDRYSYEVRHRVILELLTAELPAVPADILSGLKMTDAILSASLEKDSFIWQADLQPAFPADHFPFLYGRLAK